MSGTHTIGSYTVTKRAGAGATSAVFRARAADGRDVAVKVLFRSSADALARFERERRLLAELATEGGIVPILDAGISRDGPYVVMPFLEGGTLRNRLSRGGLPVNETIELGRMLATTMARCHARGIVHRDLKPENVLFDGDRPLVADLGLAKHFRQDVLGASQSQALSKTGELRGTPGYSAPEQLRDAKSAGPQADVFALGAILHECLSGGPAFPGTSAIEVYSRMEEGGAEPIDRPDAPAWFIRAIERALERDPARRPADAAELRRLLDAPEAPRRRVTPLVAGVAVLVAGFALVFALLGGKPAVPPPPTDPIAAPITDFLERSKLLAARGSFEEAIVQASHAVERAPKDPRGYVQRGRVELLVLEYVNAARDFEKAAQLDPTLSVAWAGRGWALGARVSTASTAAIDCAERAMKLAPDSVDSWIARSFAIRGTDPDGAIVAARKAVALAPRDARAHATLGDAVGTPGDWPAAIPHLDEALRLAPDDPYALTLRAISRYWLHRESDLARRELDRAIARAPRNYLALRLRSDLREKAGDKAGAEADLIAATGADPDDSRAWNELGHFYSLEERWPDSEAAYQRAILTAPNEPRNYDCRARIRMRREEWQGAADDFKRACDLGGGTEAVVWSMRATTALRLGHWGEAKEYAERSLEIERDNTDAVICLAEALYGLGQKASALEHYNRAVAAMPGTKTIRLMRARVHDEMGDKKAAIADFKAWLADASPQSPDYGPVRARLEHLEGKDGGFR